MSPVNKKALTETDIRTKFITPAIVGKDGGGWDVMSQVLEEHAFTAGRVMVHGKTVRRGAQKRADYILFYKSNLPLAVVEAKDNKLRQARAIIEAWRQDYNGARPHSSLGYRTPLEYAAALQAAETSCGHQVAA